jgi:superkiller protein 3
MFGLKKTGRYTPTADEKDWIVNFASNPLDHRNSPEWEKILEAADNRTDDQRSSEDYLVLSMDSLFDKSYENALSFVFAGLRLVSEDKRCQAALFMQLGTLYKLLGVQDLAIQNMDRAIGLDPENASIYNAISGIYLEQDKYRDAESKAQEAVRLSSDNAYYLSNLGHVYLEWRQFDRAEVKFLEALEIQPECPDFHVSLGKVYLAQKNYSKARDSLKKSLELNENLLFPLKALAEICVRKGQTFEGEKYVKQAMALEADSDELCNLLGDIYFGRKLYAKAELEYLGAIKINPNNAKAYKNLGHVYLEQKEYPDAEYHFKESLKLNPESAIPLINFKIIPKGLEKEYLPTEEIKQAGA